MAFALSIANAAPLTDRAAAQPAAPPAQAPVQLFLVMPFETQREPRGYWLGEGSAVLLTDELRRRGMNVIGRGERLRAFERLQVPSVATLTHGTVIRVGQLVGASSVIVGSLTLGDDEVVVRARSIGLDTGRLQAQVEERAKLEDLFALYSRVAARLVPASAASGPSEAAPPVPPLAAFESYVKGLLAETPAAQVGFLTKATELFEGYDAARLALWEAHTEAGQHDAALAAAEAVARRAASNQRARFAAAYSEIQLKRYGEAYERLRALGEQAPVPEVFNNLGVIQLRRGSTPETGKATYWFNRAASAGLADPDYFFNLGYAYLLDDDGQAAIYWLREALRRDPADADAHSVIASALRGAGAPTEADRERELAGRLSSEYERQGAAAAGKPPRGLERLKRALERSGERVETALVASAQRDQRELAGFHLDRGRRLYEAEQDNEAAAELRRAIYLSPYQPEAHLLLGRIYLRGGRTRDAIDAFKISLWSAEQAETHAALAEAYLQAHDSESARAEVSRALEMDPQNATALRVREALARGPGEDARPLPGR